MGAPVGFLGAALLFWAAQTGLWFAAVAMALVIEGSRAVGLRWTIAREDFHRIGDLSTLLFAVLVVYLYLTRDVAHALRATLAWLPITCFPLIAAQSLSAEGRLDLGALFWSLRRPSAGRVGGSVDVSYPYAVLCALSAGSANVRTPFFFQGLFVLSFWALWRARPRTSPVWAWCAAMALAGALGIGGSIFLLDMQGTLERAAIAALYGGGDQIDTERSRTAIGRVGRLQLSGGIVLRVRSDAPAPQLLRAASFNRYWSTQWFARDPDFRPLAAERGGTSWSLAPSASAARSATVTQTLSNGEGVLSIPSDTFRIEGLGAGALSLNRLGAVKISAAPAMIVYRADFGPGAGRDAPPGPDDLSIPPREAPAFAALARELGMTGAPARSALGAVERYFAANFRYTVYQGETGPAPLKDFLFKTRAGHCEYFATATVLLLRAAGIPARYATGWSVQEYSRLERAYVVRGRHAHAWAMAYVEGAWRDVDTTPSDWPGIERERGSAFEALEDLFSWAGLGLVRFRVRLAGADGRGPLAWVLLLALAGWTAWKGVSVARASRRAAGRDGDGTAVAGSDSELYVIEARLGREGLGRRPEESPAAWIERIAADLGSAAGPLRALVRLHCRYRFDPLGISAAERGELRSGARVWLAGRH
jgi:transglutaminase-like putative cysteine protease